MPFNFTWIVAIIGALLAIAAWAKTKRIGPAAAVFGGAILIIVLADPSMLTSLAGYAKGLLQKGLDQGIN